MPHPVSPTPAAGGSEALAKPSQGKGLAKGTPAARHSTTRECSQPKSNAISMMVKFSTVPVMARTYGLAFDPASVPAWAMPMHTIAMAAAAGKPRHVSCRCCVRHRGGQRHEPYLDHLHRESGNDDEVTEISDDDRSHPLRSTQLEALDDLLDRAIDVFDRCCLARR